MFRKLLTGFAVSAALLFSSHAFAAEATSVVKANQSKLFTIIAQPKTNARQAKLKSLFDEFIAYDVMAKRSLGKRWGDLDSAQQTEFSGLLTQLIRGNYRRNLKKLLEFNINYEAEEGKKRGVLVNSMATHKTDKREAPFELDFHMVQNGGRWWIVDIITEDASMVRTYKAQFLRILKKDDGYTKLIAKMKKKLAKLNG